MSKESVPTLQGYAGPNKAVRGTGSTGSSSERRLAISSRPAPGYQLNEFSRKHLQHVLTDWFPRAVYRDLTPDTARVDVIVRRNNIFNSNVYAAAFVKDDGTVIKTIEYHEDMLRSAKCPNYDAARSGYCGTKDGIDFRLVIYNVSIP